MSSFAQYQLLIVDHPQWEDDHPLRARNVRDQAVFDRLVREAERERDPSGGQPLSRAFANCRGFYLLEQCLTQPVMYAEPYLQLFSCVYGDKEDFPGEYYWALMEHGVLRRETKQFEHEAEVWREAESTLKDEVDDRGFT